MKKDTLQIFYQVIVASFSVIVVISNIISAKLVELPFFDISLPAGLITYPLTFLLSDLVTEIFGARQARIMVYIAFGMNLLGFGIIEIALLLPTVEAADFSAFYLVLGLSGIRIFASLVSYLISQIADIQIYAIIKAWSGPRYLWLRNNGSACVSQFIDTVLIDMIYLYWGMGMEIRAVLPMMLVSYLYKIFFRAANTPLFYLSIYLVNKNWERKELLAAKT